MNTPISDEELELMTLVYIKLLLTKLSNSPMPRNALGVSDESLQSLQQMQIIRLEGSNITLTPKGTNDIIRFFKLPETAQRLKSSFFDRLIKKYPEVMGPAFSMLLTYAIVTVDSQDNSVTH